MSEKKAKNQQEALILDLAGLYIEKLELYQRHYRAGPPQQISDIPILRKKDLIEDQRLHPPFGSYLNVSQEQLVRIHRTSGTSNAPLLLAVTAADVENISNTGSKAFCNAGLTKGDIVINCMNYCMWMGGFMDHQSLERTGAAVIPYGVGHTENLIELILSIPNVCIHSTPSYLQRLEQEARELFHLEPRQLGIKKGFFGGEGGLQNKEYRNKLEQTWGMEIYDANYGMSEVMSIIASEDKNKDGLVYIAGDVVYPELLIEEMGSVSNENIAPGKIGELVLTNLKKEAQPLLRYATGDIIEVMERYEENGVCTKFRFKVIGRADDMIVVKGINFYPSVIQSVISKYKECTGNYKVIVGDHILTDRIKLILEVKEELQNLVPLQTIKKEIKSKYFVSCEIEMVDHIPMNGNKVKLVERAGEY